MTYKPTRVFNGAAGQPSKDNMGPEVLSADLDKIIKMFDPEATHGDSQQGGIGTGNLNFSFGEDGSGGGDSMAETIGSKEIPELKDPSSPSTPALTVWKQIKATVMLFVAHATNNSNPHAVTNAQVGLGNVTNNLQATKTEFDAHKNNVANPHGVTKSQVGLGDVDNTSDANKPVSSAALAALGNKVDKVAGKALSTNDYDNTEKASVASNTSARHTHSNKALLDSYNQSNANLTDAVSKKHSHANNVLLDTYDQTNVNIADAVNKKHVHANGTVLDAITGTMTTAWNALVTLFAGITGVVTTVTNDNAKIPTSGAIVDYVASIGGGDMLKSMYDPTGKNQDMFAYADSKAVTIANNLTETVAGKALDATKGKALNDLISTHLAETPYCNYVTRDISTAGVQTITGLPFAAKKVTFRAYIGGTAIISNGVSVGTTQHQASIQDSSGVASGTAAKSITLQQAGSWVVEGKVTAITASTIEITWNIASGTPSGTATILFEADPH